MYSHRVCEEQSLQIVVKMHVFDLFRFTCVTCNVRVLFGFSVSFGERKKIVKKEEWTELNLRRNECFDLNRSVAVRNVVLRRKITERISLKFIVHRGIESSDFDLTVLFSALVVNRR